MFGPRVERDRLVEILDLLASARHPIHFLMASTESHHRKTIYIGAYNLDGELVAPFTPELHSMIRAENPRPSDLLEMVLSASTVTAITAR